MTVKRTDDYVGFREAVQGLLNGDFSRLEPLFGDVSSQDFRKCRILEWHSKGYFDEEPKALAEALTCACFLGRTAMAEFLMEKGVDPTAGSATGLNGFHWAADRGQLETVQLLIKRRGPLEVKNMYGGTVLGTAVWSVIHEPREQHMAIIEALINAGAQLEAVGYPTGNARVDELLRRHGAQVTEQRSAGGH